MKEPVTPPPAQAFAPVGRAHARSAAKMSAAATAAVLLPPTARFPIVGIGASAGGLEALEQFLKGVPPASGLAFVVVQHLDPTHRGIMVELLQRCTPLPVRQITDRMTVEPDHVYVIPPNRDLSILHGVLYLLEPAAPRGLRLPIDFFLRSLAADRQQRSIGVILSGMGSDGTLGLRAIKEVAGAVFVQSPASAKFDGMPRSAIGTGLADRVAAAEDLAGQIVAYLRHVPLFTARPDAMPDTMRDTMRDTMPEGTRPDAELPDTEQSGLEKVVLLLRAHTGHDFSLYKKSTLYRRIERRMGLHQLVKIADYVRYLRENTQEGELLFKELLIGVTNFFRDAPVWEQLGTEVLPALLAARPAGAVLRAWVPACSTGEEAYTLAMVFREAVEQAQQRPGKAANWSLQVFATDLDKDAIDKARNGAYPANIAADVTEARLNRFFVPDARGWRVGKEIREMVIFAPQNLVVDPPFTKLDLLSCRNLLIYLEADLQKKLLPLFHYSLNPGGVLVLGSAETTGPASDLFDAVPGKNRIYRRKATVLPPDLVEFPAAFAQRRADGPASHSPASRPSVPVAPAEPNLQALTDALVLRRFSPAAVLATAHGDLVYTSAKTGKYLEPATGKANLNLFAMAREGLAGPLVEAFARTVRQQVAVVLKGLRVGSDGGTHTVDVTVQWLTEPAALAGMVLVVFTDVAAVAAATPGRAPAKARGKAPRETSDDGADFGTDAGMAAGAELLAAQTEETARAREELQAARKDMLVSQEELRSTNEELQSTNEELQRTNEELTTSTEEMQSMNEELHTVNQELTTKVDELSLASDDMSNLLNSTDIATLFLDNELKVRRFTTQAASIVKLLPGDAGRPITDLANVFNTPALADDAREVLRSLVTSEVRLPTQDGRWLRVRTMPYRTQDHRIDGVVITFTDISVSKALEATLREALAVLQSRVKDQAAELGAAHNLEGVLQAAQAVLEQRLGAQTAELHQARADVLAERELSAGRRPFC